MIKSYLFALSLALGLFIGCQAIRQLPPPKSAPIAHKTAWGIPLAPCAWCGTTRDVEVHHVYPQHLWPARAHDTNNMVCLCRRCHFVLGHRCCWTNAVTNLIQMIDDGKK